jgi:Flp pilus assembly pilin Flp
MRIRNFLSDESGAVAVDWVVITAGITGMGLAVIATASGGLEDLSGEIRTTLGEQMEAVVALATAGLTATAIWNDPTNSTRDFANIDELSFVTEVDFTTDAEGIIFEFGATGRVAPSSTSMMAYFTCRRAMVATTVRRPTGARRRGRSSTAGRRSRVPERRWRSRPDRERRNGQPIVLHGFSAGRPRRRQYRGIEFRASRPTGAGSPATMRAIPGVSEVVMFEGQTTGHELVPLD